MDIKSLHKIFLKSGGVCTDSRKIKNNEIFFALSGDNFDGNQFAKMAIEQGAGYAVISDVKYKLTEKYILVPDVLECLQKLANFHRKSLTTPIIAITGTNGKTTTKELISRVLQKKFKVAFTQGNLNNHIGVPLTLLSFNKETEIGVVEMGANHIREIAALCEIAMPDYGIINNIGKAHLEGFGSFEGVIEAKSELYNYCRINGKKIFVNGDDELLVGLSNGMDRILYGKLAENDVRASFIYADPLLSLEWKNHKIDTQLVGEYNFHNVLAAITVGDYFSVPEAQICQAISEYTPQNNRSQLTKTKSNTLIIDAYNANPSSMELSIRNFAKINFDNKLPVLGDMFELGSNSIQEHQKIIELVKSLEFKNAIFVGKAFYSFSFENYLNFDFFQSTNELSEYLKINKIKNHTILLKASRGVQLEKVLNYL